MKEVVQPITGRSRFGLWMGREQILNIPLAERQDVIENIMKFRNAWRFRGRP